jgi:hypothetical protein
VSEAVHPGQCRCGAVRIEASGPPLVTMACHCTGCQRMTGGAYSVSSFYPADRFTVTKGRTVRGGLKTGPDHEFCPECMSWMFTVAKEIEGFVNVRSTMFDDAPLHRPYVETYLAEAMPGAASGAAHSYVGSPQESEFPGLIAGYAEWNEGVKQ